MIWYERNIGSTRRITGVYNDPMSSKPTIQILLNLGGREITLFEHSPAMLSSYEPTSDEVFMRYKHKIMRIIKAISSMSDDDIVSKFCQ